MARPKGSKNKATTAKKPRKSKKTSETKTEQAAPKAAAAGGNEPKADPKMRELARHHRDTYITRKAALTKAQRAMQALGKEVKADGLTMRQIKLMVELSTPEGEAAWRMTVANDLIAAQYQGAAIGQQLALFLEPDRTPSVDIAYDEGVQDSMDGKTAKSPYDPSLPQTQSYLKGYHDETERRIKAGIKPTEPGYPEGSPLKQPSNVVATRADEMAAKRAAAVTDKPAGNA